MPTSRSRPAPAPGLILALAAGLLAPGCASEKRQITPTTLGTDLRTLPRGRMTPQPFPGSDLARSKPLRPAAARTLDPATALATAEGGEAPPR